MRTSSVIGLVLILATFALGMLVTTADGTPVIDARIMMALSSWREPGTRQFWLVASSLGDGEVRLAITGVVAVALIVMRRRADALLLLGTVAIGLAANSLLKLLFARPRPDMLPHLDMVTSLSFPSGHAAHSAILYGLIGLIAASMARDGSILRPAIIAVAATLIALVGLSRIVLGVHWPSDVLAGWALGIGLALIGWSARAGITRRFYQP